MLCAGLELGEKMTKKGENLMCVILGVGCVMVPYAMVGGGAELFPLILQFFVGGIFLMAVASILATMTAKDFVVFLAANFAIMLVMSWLLMPELFQ